MANQIRYVRLPNLVPVSENLVNFGLDVLLFFFFSVIRMDMTNILPGKKYGLATGKPNLAPKLSWQTSSSHTG